MAVAKTKSGYKVDFRPGGANGRRIRKTFTTKAEALRYESHVRAKIIKNPDWNPDPKDKRRLSELVDIWYQLHGKFLDDGERCYNKLKSMCLAMQNPIASQFDAKDLAKYRAERSKKVSLNTVNHEHTYLCAVFNKLIELKEWKHANPIAGIGKFKIDEQELAFLELNQIETLFKELEKSRSPDVRLVAELCLATGRVGVKRKTCIAAKLKTARFNMQTLKPGNPAGFPLIASWRKNF